MPNLHQHMYIYIHDIVRERTHFNDTLTLMNSPSVRCALSVSVCVSLCVRVCMFVVDRHYAWYDTHLQTETVLCWQRNFGTTQQTMIGGASFVSQKLSNCEMQNLCAPTAKNKYYQS